MPDSLSIWRISDGRRGHDNQSLGLTDALARRVRASVLDIPVRGGLTGAVAAWRARSGAPAPKLVVGAGHATHVALLVAARRQGARSVVLMNPSLPRRLFDLCVIPRHDGIAEGGNVILSLGALNRVLLGGHRDPSLGLLLIGGPSRHHGWDADALVRQAHAVATADPRLRWIAAASPRTPTDTLTRLRDVPGLATLPFDQCEVDWLPTNLSRASRVWVTADSVSMAFEAASSGAAVGILDVPTRRPGRVQSALASLLASGRAVRFDDWQSGHELAPPARPLQEAERCASALLARWPDLG